MRDYFQGLQLARVAYIAPFDLFLAGLEILIYIQLVGGGRSHGKPRP